MTNQEPVSLPPTTTTTTMASGQRDNSRVHGGGNPGRGGNAESSLLTNDELAERIRALTAGHAPSAAEIQSELGKLLQAVVATSVSSSSASGDASRGAGDEPATPTLLPLYLATLLRAAEADPDDNGSNGANDAGTYTGGGSSAVPDAEPSNGSSSPPPSSDTLADRVAHAAGAFVASNVQTSQPPAQRAAGARALTLLLSAAPRLGARVFAAHSEALVDAISEDLELAADAYSSSQSSGAGAAGPKLAAPALVTAYLDLLAHAAGDAAARKAIAEQRAIVDAVRVFARPAPPPSSASSSNAAGASNGGVSEAWRLRARTLAMNVLTKMDYATVPGSGVGASAASGVPTGFHHQGKDPAPMLAVLTNPTSTASDREVAMETLALAALRVPFRRALGRPENLTALMQAMKSALPAKAPASKLALGAPGAPVLPSHAYVYAFVTVIDHLTMYAPPESPERAQLRKLAVFAATGRKVGGKNGTGKTSPDGGDGDDDDDDGANALSDRDQDARVDARCAALVGQHVVGLLQRLCGPGGAGAGAAGASDAVKAGVARICAHIARTPALRGKLVQQGGVPLLARLRGARDAALALARCCISLNPALAVPEALVPSVASMVLDLLPDERSERAPVFGVGSNSARASTDAAAVGDDEDDAAAPLRHFEALLALTNLSTLPALHAKHPAWLVRLDAAGSLTSGNTDIRRAAWELLGNMLCCGTAAFDAVVQRDRQRDLLVRMAVPHAHPDEPFPMRRAALGVLAMLTFAPPPCEALLRAPADSTGANQAPIVRLRELLGSETDPELLHRLLRLWFNLCHLPEAQAWARQHGIIRLLQTEVRPRVPNQNEEMLSLVDGIREMLADSK